MLFIISGAVAFAMALFELYVVNEQHSVLCWIKAVIKNFLSVSLVSIAMFKSVLHHPHFLDTTRFTNKHYIEFAIISIFSGIILQLVFAVFNNRIIFGEQEPEKKNGLALTVKIFSVILFALGAAAYFGTVWGREAFGKVTGDQLIINLTSPTEGTESSVYIDGFEGPVFQTLLVTVFFSLFNFGKFKIILKKSAKNITVLSGVAKRVLCFFLALAVLAGGVTYGINKFKLVQVFNSYVLKSDLIEEQYADPETVNIRFPEKKRNLIHIYLESMENSYLSKDLGGNIDENLIPELAEIAKQGVVFSNTDNYFGGPLQGTGTQWSVASMINQTTGLPMKAPGRRNTYGKDGKFLPGAYTLGEILEKQGYEQTMMIGASAKFGALDYYYSTHGNWKIMDYDYAKENGMIPKDYMVWWGYEDRKLYKFAKEEITRLYNTGKPFNFTMENADTHRPGGYLPKKAQRKYKSHYANAIANSSKDLGEFLEWIMEQPFYENTTIVLIGDHLSMDAKFFKDYNFDGYFRTQYNVIINPAPSVGKPDESITRNRKWANWDYFPTIVASIGGEIEGERLGVGTNLFSGKETIYEELGVKYVDKEFEKGSEFYNKEIMQTENLQDALNKNGKYTKTD